MNQKCTCTSAISATSSLPDKKTLTPGHIPVSVYIQEVENLCHWCRPDTERLESTGLGPELISGLPDLIDALR